MSLSDCRARIVAQPGTASLSVQLRGQDAATVIWWFYNGQKAGRFRIESSGGDYATLTIVDPPGPADEASFFLEVDAELPGAVVLELLDHLDAEHSRVFFETDLLDRWPWSGPVEPARQRWWRRRRRRPPPGRSHLELAEVRELIEPAGFYEVEAQDWS